MNPFGDAVRAAVVVMGGMALSAAQAASFTGPSSSASPYVTPTGTGVEVTSVLTVGDEVGGYAMVGIPDGLGAYDNGDGTFTVLMNHELRPDVGDTRAHGATGAFVSEWVVSNTDFSVISGRDLVTSHLVWDGAQYVAAAGDANRFGRLCSSDLPAVSAFYNASSGLGTQSRIYMSGEEVGAEGRGYAFVATGADKGTAYELPALGKFSWENSVANPLSGDKTVVIGLDDSTPGQLYVYLGDKSNTGSDVDRAGLTGGSLFGVKVAGQPLETSVISGGFNLESVNAFQSGADLQTQSNGLDITNFARPEDGHWADADTFYFVTTGGDPDGAAGPAGSQSAKLYRMDFTPDYQSGSISLALDSATLVGTDGDMARSFDNMVVADNGLIYIQEDPGNNDYIAKTWQYNPLTGDSVQVLESDRNRFLTGATDFLTRDEESSGVIDITSVLGRNDGRQYYLADMQAHYANGSSLIEGGQLYIFSTAVPEPGSLLIAAAALATVAVCRRRAS